VEAVIYVMSSTRGNLVFTISALSSFMNAPRTMHCQDLKSPGIRVGKAWEVMQMLTLVVFCNGAILW
jgi:hypothetical protein